MRLLIVEAVFTRDCLGLKHIDGYDFSRAPPLAASVQSDQ
jgi:hypothetical protein